MTGDDRAALILAYACPGASLPGLLAWLRSLEDQRALWMAAEINDDQA